MPVLKSPDDPQSSSQNADTELIAKLCEVVLKNPVVLRTVSDRVYALLQEDIRNQGDRTGHSPRRLS